MQIIYQSIYLDLPYPVVQVLEVRKQEGLNSHAVLQVLAVIGEEKAEEYFHQLVEGRQIKAGFPDEKKTVFFVGNVERADIYYEKGQAVLRLTAVSVTKEWDIVKRKRSFQNADDTYGDIISQVLSGYEKASWISRAETKRKIPGLLLQYEETDWEFLCRLASHFNTFLMVDPSGEIGQVFFGLPKIDNGHRVEGDHYALSQDMTRYQSYTQNAGQELAKQENLTWEVEGRIPYQLGEQVAWRHVACQVTGTKMRVKEGEIWYTHRLGRTAGVKSQFYGNPVISGLSLPAVIKERKGNCLRVHFSIDESYQEGNNPYFTFAIETVSWYCLPEEGSLVHIYFQNWEETSAIAVHAMRASGSAAARDSVSARGAIGDKSFSTGDGKAMKLTETGILFESGENQASTVTLVKDGSLKIDGRDIILSTPMTLEAGRGELVTGDVKTEVFTKSLELECEAGDIVLGILEFSGEEAALATDKGIALSADGTISIVASEELSYSGVQKDPPGIQYSDEELKAQDKAQRDAHNREVFEVQEQAAKSKFSIGAILAVGGLVIAGAAITVLSGGFAAPAALALIGGAVGGLCGAAQMDEAILDMQKLESGDFSKSYNAIRDGVFGGNQELYNTVMYGSIMLGAALLLAPLAKPLGFWGKLLFQAGSNGLLSTGTSYLMDGTDGYIDGTWEEYLLNFGKSAGMAALGYLAAAGLVHTVKNVTAVKNILGKTGNFAPALIIGAETAVDVGVDYIGSRVYGTDFELGKSIILNLTSNIVFSIDPVDMATGAFCLEAVDLTYPDMLEEEFRIRRFYHSLLSCRGLMGRGWRLNLESRLFFHEEKQRVDVLCLDGHMEEFVLQGDTYRNKRAGDGRYLFREQPQKDGFSLLDVPEHRQYDYDRLGRLISMSGKGKARMTVQYEENRIRRVSTSSGYVLDFSYEEDRIVEIRDDIGRRVQYKYEEEYLTAVCHVDEGITSYEYDESHHICQVTDQNGHSYVRNEYDERGRVCLQHYPDGTRSRLEYDEENRQNTVYIEALDRIERYRYNQASLITHIYYQDGTQEVRDYDRWTNRVYEKDRNGNVRRRVYNDWGGLTLEELPSGQRWEYKYDEKKNLVVKRADTGQEFRYCYDENGFLTEEKSRIGEDSWQIRQYERDSYGRVRKKTDSRGNTTGYAYYLKDKPLLKAPCEVTDPTGSRTRYEYDGAGRRISIRTDQGTVEFSYNRQNYLCTIVDGNEHKTQRFYDKMGNLVYLLPPNKENRPPGWRFEYDSFDRLIETRDPLGTVWKLERNLAGDVTREIHPAGYAQDREEGFSTRYEYDSDSRKIRTIYPDGSVERYVYDGNGNLIKKIRPEFYDEKTDSGKGISYRYDSMNRLIRITDEEGHVQKSYVYDASGNLTQETAATGQTTYHTYDYLGNRTATWRPEENTGSEILYAATFFEYDTEGNRIRERRGCDKVPRGGRPSRFHELSFDYDRRNRLREVSDGCGAKAVYRYNCLNQRTYESFQISETVKRIVGYRYDSAGNLIERKEGIEERFQKEAGGDRILWSITRYEYDSNGNCTQMVTPRGYRRSWYYDEVDRVIKEEETDPEGGLKRILRYEYDAAGNLLRRIDESCGEPSSRSYRYDKKDRLTHYIDENQGVTRIFYDKNDRVVKTVRPEQYDREQDDGPGLTFTYNSQDKILSVTGPDQRIQNRYAYDRAGNLQSVRDGDGVCTEYAYDLNGRPSSVRRGGKETPVSQTFTYDAQGNITGVKDGRDHETRFVLDGWGRITEIHTPDGQVERYTYDYAGNITSTEDACGGIIRYEYNSLGKVYRITDPEGRSETIYYDMEGRPELRVDRRGNRIRTRYNMDNRLLYQRAEDARGRNAITSRYRYYPDGRLREAVGGGTAYQYEYTATGLLKGKSSNGRSLLSYSYDQNGNVTELTDEAGKSTRYSYDSQNRLKQVRAPKPIASYEYTDGGRIQSLSYGNGMKTEYTYREDGRMGSLVTMTSDGRVVLDYDYSYDESGNCTGKSGEHGVQKYSYDQRNRLIEAVYNGSEEHYTYDGCGNRLKKETKQWKEEYFYNRKNQLIERRKISRQTGETETTAYGYDEQGNLVLEQGEKEVRRYTYDARNRQIRVESGGRIIQTNRYDGEGLRYEMEEEGRRIRFLYDRGELAAEEGEGWKHYYRGAHTLASESEGELNYFVGDEMGSTMFLLDSEQRIQKSYRYDVFGGILETSGTIWNRITYTGQIYDGASGQYYLRARFYDPEIGRFLQEDVYRGDGLNLYAYCRNNPVMYYDPSGYMALCPVGKNEPQGPGEKEIIEGTGEPSTPSNITVTEEMIREVMKDAPFQTQQSGGVSLPVIQRYVDRILAGETNVPAIYVDNNIIVNGNHRYIASRIVGIEINTQSWYGGNPSKVADWDTIPIDSFDWGNH